MYESAVMLGIFQSLIFSRYWIRQKDSMFPWARMIGGWTTKGDLGDKTKAGKGGQVVRCESHCIGLANELEPRRFPRGPIEEKNKGRGDQ